jgi:glycosyltransferase involved in cell wall biosynthesis
MSESQTIKLLVVYNKVWSYRERIFDIVNKHFDLTVAFTDPQFVDKKFSFKTIYTPGRWRGPFFIHDKSLKSLCSGYDAVLALHEVRCLSIMRISLIRSRKYSLTYWGIGVSASYEKKFDNDSTWDKFRFFTGRRAESVVFYSDYPINKFVKAGFPREKLFVANNTTNVSGGVNLNAIKDSFLFIGTLYKQKGFDILLNAYGSITDVPREDIPVLNIIGEGPERQFIEQWIKEHKMEDKIFLHGAIYDIDVLKSFYEKSIACISPNQAGLSVLTSMGYATAFVTEKDAITGGEIFNIENMENGIIYEGGAEVLKDKLIWIISNKQKTIEMGKKAKEFYDNYRTPEMMAQGLMDAVNYALKVKHNA